MDSPVSIPRAVVPSVVFLRSEIPASHPSAAVLGQERMGAGVAVGEHLVLTAHYLVLGASSAVVVGGDGRPREARRVALDHETGLALLSVDGPDLRPAPRPQRDPAGRPPRLPPDLHGRARAQGRLGLVASVGPFEAFWEYMLDDAIMTTVLNPGLAGAPLFDADARVVGIISLGSPPWAATASPSPSTCSSPGAPPRRRSRADRAARVARRLPAGQRRRGGHHGRRARRPAEQAGLAQGDLVLPWTNSP